MRPKLRSPGHPKFQRVVEAAFWVEIAKGLLPVEAALTDIAEIPVSPSDAATLARGQAILIRGRDAPVLVGPAYAICKGRIVAIGELSKGTLQPTRVFNLGGR